MRKYVAVLCALAIAGSLCACKKADKATSAKPKTKPSASTPVTVEGENAPLNLTYTSPFLDGVALVSYLGSDGVEKSAAINTKGEILFHLPEDMPLDGPGYQQGIRVVGNLIYDKTGKVIANPADTGYDALLTGNCNGYVLAKKTDQPVLPAPEASGNPTETVPTPTGTVLVGVLNNKGEWVHEPSADHPVAKAMAAAKQPTEVFTYVTEDVLRVSVDAESAPCYYHFKSNKLTADYVRYASGVDEEGGISYVYRASTDGKREKIVKNMIGDYFFADAFIGRAVTPPTALEESVIGGYKLYDYTGKVLMDVSAYTFETSYYIKGFLLLITTDEVGSRQVVLLDKNGQPVMEPMAMGMLDVCYPPDDSGFVLSTQGAEGMSYTHYDYKGNATPYTGLKNLAGFSEGLALATLLENPDRFCYINQKGEIVIR